MELFIVTMLTLIAIQTSYLFLTRVLKKGQQRTSRPIFVDTSVLIDGRITSVARSGFVDTALYIPRSVIGELQLLADTGDSDKRTRARHGLDVVAELQEMPMVKVKIFRDSNRAEEGVDSRLLKLAKRYNGSICTIDYNLAKVALVEGIKVLNINDLAMSLRMLHLPGEKTHIELIQHGQDSHQAVGYLGDGTMVVIERASSYIGKTVEVEFIRSLQTAAGRMMFAKLVNEKESSRESKHRKQSNPKSK